jgi:hypothetical protein
MVLPEATNSLGTPLRCSRLSNLMKLILIIAQGLILLLFPTNVKTNLLSLLLFPMKVLSISLSGRQVFNFGSIVSQEWLFTPTYFHTGSTIE